MNKRRVLIFTSVIVLGLTLGSVEPALAQETPGPAVSGDSAVTTDNTGNSANLSSNQSVDNLSWVALGSIAIAGLTIAIGSIGPALGEGRAVSQALSAIAQQPDSSNTITRTLFVGLAMIESTAIYCFVVSMILLFANPFWKYFIQ